MPDPARNWAKAIETLDPKRAERWSAHDNKLWSDGDLVAYWPGVPESVMEECESYLRLYCDVSNATKARTWCQDPKIKEATYPGKWRLFRVYFDRGKSGQPGIVRELKRGFATTASWTEALQVDGDSLQANAYSPDGDQTERYLHVVFPNVDPDYVSEIVTALETETSVTNPVVQGKVRTGLWHYIHVKPEKQEDGSFWIRLFMGMPQYSFSSKEKVGTPDVTDVTYYWNVPKKLAQALATSKVDPTPPAVADLNASTSANYSTGQGLVDIIFRRRGTVVSITISEMLTETGNTVTASAGPPVVEAENWTLVREYTEWTWGLSKAEVVAKALKAKEVTRGDIKRIDGISYDGQGNYSIKITRQQAVEKEICAAKVIHIDAGSSVLRDRYINKTDVPPLLTLEAGKVKKLVELDMNRYGLWDYTVDTETVNELSNWLAEYDAATTYAKDARVSKDYVSWKSLKDSNTGNTPAEGEWWTAGSDGPIIEASPSATVHGYHIEGAASRPEKPTVYGSLNVVRRQDGLWYGTKTDITYPATWSNVEYTDKWTNVNETGLTREVVDFCEEGGKKKRRTITFTYDLKQTRSYAAALLHNTGGKWGSKIITHSNARGAYGYESFKVTSVVFGKWVDDIAGAL